MVEWTAERKEPKDSPPFVIIKGKVNQSQHYADVQVIVSMGHGFKHTQGYKKYQVNPQLSSYGRPVQHGAIDSKSIEVLMSMNGPAAMSFEDMAGLVAAIQSARDSLDVQIEAADLDIQGTTEWDSTGGTHKTVITHKPTGEISVATDRSVLRAREKAMVNLRKQVRAYMQSRGEW